jgi:glycosyltransferase involved in cell wall biosynthesis
MKKNQGVIAIDGSRAFLAKRTGIEEYSYQLLMHLREVLEQEAVVVYIRADQKVDFALPVKWRVKKLWAPRLWTQVRLSFELLLHRPRVLLVPAHTAPLVCFTKTVVVVHGLEYEFCPDAYSWWSRIMMRWMICSSAKAAAQVVCVSESTKRDLMCLYGIAEAKITVVYEGCAIHQSKENQKKNLVKGSIHNPYFLFIGRIEARKNIVRFIEAFELFKETYQTSHQLVLAGKGGYGYEAIREKKAQSFYAKDIVELGYVSEKEKWQLLQGAEVFLFATLYEGFGLPVLEAQAVGVPVITSSTSSLPEVAGEGAIVVDPESVEQIAHAMVLFFSKKSLRRAILEKGRVNVERFSWHGCAQAIAEILKNKNRWSTL